MEHMEYMEDSCHVSCRVAFEIKNLVMNDGAAANVKLVSEHGIPIPKPVFA